MKNALLFLFSCGLLPAPGEAQRVWYVDQFGGPGHHFTDVQQAVDASYVVAGDVLVLRGGFPSLVTSKGVTMIGLPNTNAGIVACTIRNLPIGETFSFEGISGETVVVQDSPGRVIMDRPLYRSVRLRRATDVHIYQTYTKDLLIEFSKVYFTDGVIGCLLPGECSPGHIPAEVRNSEVTLNGTFLIGIAGYIDPVWCMVVRPSYPAARSWDSRYYVSHGGGLSGGYAENCNLIEHATVFTAGSSGNVILADPFARVGRTAPATTVIRERLAGLRCSAGRGAAEIVAWAFGEPWQPYLLFASLPAAPTPTAIGQVWLDAGTVLWIATGFLGSSGFDEIRVPWNPLVLPVMPLALQGLVASGSPYLSSPAHVVLNVKAWRRF